MKRAPALRLIAAAAVATAAYLGVHAIAGTAKADDLQGDIKARQALMKQIGAQAKAIYAVVDAKSGDMADMQKRALQVKADIAKAATLFPTGTSTDDFPGKTHALPAIWKDMDSFKADATNLETQAGKLADAAQGGDMSAFAAQFAATGKACGTCHTDFRAKLN